jgi:Flp pilus assembly protein TadD
MNRFASKFAASSLVIAAAMVGCHSDSVVGSASASTEQRAHQQAARLAEQAQSALQEGDAARALTFAERAVEASPQDVGYRMLLADIYLKNGRFRSAEAAYDDVRSLDTANVRAGLSIALTQIAQGRSDDALVQLEQMQDSAPPSDVGLAFALAGQPQRAIELLEPAARATGANGRTRQNLALAYALAGDWQRARAVAAQDVSPAELGRRLQHWASLAQPSGQQSAVATLLGVTPVADPGRPVRLALQLPAPVAEAYAEAAPAEEAAPAAPARVEAPVQLAEAFAPEPVAAAPVQDPIQYAEVPVVTAPEPVRFAAAPASAPARTAAQAVQSASWWPAPSAAAPAPAETPSEPVQLAEVELAAPAAAPAPAPAPAPAAQEAPARYAAAMRSLSAPSPVLTRSPATVARTARPTFVPAPISRAAAVSARIPRIASGSGRFVVQLGAFANAANAERAWAQASRRFGFAASEARTARVTVNGREVTRVSLAGFATRADAVRVCSSIQARGGSCFVRAAAGDAPVRWASQGRAAARG